MGRKTGWLKGGEWTRAFSKFKSLGVNEVFNAFMSSLISLVLDSNFADTIARTSFESLTSLEAEAEALIAANSADAYELYVWKSFGCSDIGTQEEKRRSPANLRLDRGERRPRVRLVVPAPPH